MSSNEQQIKNSFIYLIPVVASNLVAILTLSVFTRILTTADYGILALAQIYAMFVSGVANLGLTNIYNRNFFQYSDRKGSSELLYSVLLFVGTTLTVCAIFTFLYKESLSELITGSSEHGSLLFWVFCSNSVISLKTYYFNYFRNSEEAKNFVKYTICEIILTVVLSFYLVAYMKIGVIGLVWGQLLAGSVVFLTITVRFLSFLPVSFNWQILKFSLRLGFPSTPSLFLKVMSTQFDKYMIGLMVTAGAVGIYSIGMKVAYIVFTFMTAIENVFVPNTYKKMFALGEKGGEDIGCYLTPFIYVSIAIALTISLFSEEVIMVLTPKSYHGAADIIIILSLFYGSLFFGKIPQLLFAKKVFISSLLNIFRVCLNIALNIPFIIKWGAIGAAWATLIAGLISGIIFFSVSQHYYKIKWEYKKVGAIFLILFVSSVLMILLRKYMVDYYTIRVLTKIFFVGSYVYLGVKLNIITKGNYVLVKNMFPFKSIPLLQR